MADPTSPESQKGDEAVERSPKIVQGDMTGEEMQHWLSPPADKRTFENTKDLRQEDFCLWFLRSTKFEEWKKRPKSFLWVHGPSGCGKTVLSSAIIQDLIRDAQNLDGGAKDRAAVLYSFATPQEQERGALYNIVGSVLFQLCFRPPYPSVPSSDPLFVNLQPSALCSESLVSLFCDCGYGRDPPATSQLIDEFQALARMTGRISIVVDGLDQIEEVERADVLSWISALFTVLEDVHIIVVSQNTGDIEERLKNIDDTFPIENNDVSDDIGKYVDGQLASRLKLWDHEPDFKTKIKTAIVAKANGTFRLAASCVDELVLCRDTKSLFDRINNLPSTPRELYARSLSLIPKTGPRGSLNMLQFLVYSGRPLTVLEAAAILTFCGSGYLEYGQPGSASGLREVISSCGPYLVALDDSGPEDKTILTATLRLAHPTVKEFLQSSGADNIFSNQFREPRAHLSILQILLAYVCSLPEAQPFKLKKSTLANHTNEDPEPPFKLDESVIADYTNQSLSQTFKLEASVLADYTNQYLFYHAQGAEKEPGGVETIMKFLNNDKALKEWLCSYSAASRIAIRRDKRIAAAEGMPSSLFIAARFGLQQTVKRILETGVKYTPRSILYPFGPLFGFYFEHSGGSRRDYTQCTVSPLYAAAENGHAAIVKMLVESGADVETRTGEHGSPFKIACRRKEPEVLDVLLNIVGRDAADLDDCVYSLRTALEEGNTCLTRVFLERGFLPDEQEPHLNTVIYEAVSRGHVDILELLLAHSGVSVSDIAPPTIVPTDTRKICPQLYYWPRKTADESDVDPSLPTKTASLGDCAQRFGSLLHVASLEGWQPVVRLLLDRGMDPNSAGGVFGSALQAACAGGHSGVVEELLHRGADVNSRGGFYGSPLRAALEGVGPSPTSHMSQRIAPREPPPPGAAQPHWTHDYPKIARALLDRDATPVHAQQELSLALKLDKEDVALSIIARVAKLQPHQEGYVPLADLFSDTVIHESLEKHFDRVVEKILSERADMHVRDSSGQTPFHVAARHSSARMMEILLQAAPKPQLYALLLKDNRQLTGDTALHTAVRCGSLTKTRIILQAAKSSSFFEQLLQAVDNRGRTAFHLAAEQPNTSTVDMFVQSLPPPSLEKLLQMQDDKGMTVLHSKVSHSPVDEAVSLIAKLAQAAKQLEILSAFLDQRDSNGRTALHHAAFRGSPELVAALLHAGSDPSLEDRCGGDFAHSAKQGAQRAYGWWRRLDCRYQDILNAAFHRPATDAAFAENVRAARLHCCVRNNDLCAAERVLRGERGARPSFVNVQDAGTRKAPLHWAVERGAVEMVVLLLGHGADVHAKDVCGKTPLHVAAEGEVLGLVGELAGAGAAVFACDQIGRTPLMCAEDAKNEGAIGKLRELEAKEDCAADGPSDDDEKTGWWYEDEDEVGFDEDDVEVDDDLLDDSE